ncbi:MAG: winged helix-turn-helix domain-containing protein [Actinomycetota bacterium]
MRERAEVGPLLEKSATTTPSVVSVANGSPRRGRWPLVDGRDVQLSHREFALALTFFRHAGEILTREKLLAHVWGTDDDPSSNGIDVQVGALRKKLGAHRISTVRGMGFRLED